MSVEKELCNISAATSKSQNEKLETYLHLGKSMLEQNSYLEEMLQQANIEYEKKIEDYEQEKYSLEIKLEEYKNSTCRLEEWYADEKKALQQEHGETIESLVKAHKEEVDSLKHKTLAMQKELEENILLNNQQYDKIEKQQATISQLKLSQPKHLKNDSLTPELVELTSENEELRAALESVQEEADERGNLIEQLNFKLKETEKTMEFLSEMKESAQVELRSLTETLEQCRHDNRELSAELEELRSQPQDPNSRGNSLFAEVEDRRIQAEKRLISIQVKMKCMERKYTQQVNYSMKLKTQIAQLLQSGGKEADRDHISRLERSLVSSRSDTKELMGKVAELERKLATKNVGSLSEMKKGDAHDQDFTSFLEALIKKKDTEVEKLQDELQKCRLHLMAESRKVTEADQAIYTAKSDGDKLKAQCIKQRMEITRLKLKCGEDVQGKRNVRPGKTERIPSGDAIPSVLTAKENIEKLSELSVDPTLRKKEQGSSPPPDGSTINYTSLKHSPGTTTALPSREGTLPNSNADSDCPVECKQQ